MSNAVGSALQLTNGVTFTKAGTFTINGSGKITEFKQGL